MKRSRVGALACMAILGGCEQAAHEPTSPGGETEATASSSAPVKSDAVNQVEIHVIAGMIAQGLADPAVRAAVRDAMRASSLTEHKLAFHEFLRTSAGEMVVREAARASNIATASLRARMHRLPALDFYVPVSTHRLGWRGTPDYFVGASVAGKPPSTVFDPSGQEVAANLDKLASGSAALLMLQSAERKGRRIGPQALVPAQRFRILVTGSLAVH